ncbi:MAG: ABC transporter permease, partial [Deinococcota bacterium]
QYQDWLGNLTQGDLGFSFISRSPINELLWQGFKVTIVLSSLAVLLALVIAVPLGIWAAQTPGRLDSLIGFTSQTGVALPEYWVAPLLILFFSLQLGWLPTAGWRGPLYLVMPVVTLALRPIAYFTSLVRQAMLEVLDSDYIRTAKAKGLSLYTILFKHALRNAFLPVLTMSGLWFASLLGGSVIVEVIFAVPGMGRLIFDAVLANDLPLLQASLMILVALTTLTMTATDILYNVLNPAIQIDHRNF